MVQLVTGKREDTILCYFFILLSTKEYYLCISELAMEEDSPLLAVELDVDELAKDHKA